jgi:dolichol-phosphate mannosyltransferase
MARTTEAQPRLSVVVPACDEAENISPLLSEILAAMENLPGGFEIVIVEDGSADETDLRLATLAASEPRLRALRLLGADRGAPLGQSAAFAAGVQAARGRVVAMLDADLQNPPCELPRLLAHLEETQADMVQGDRSQARQDGVMRRVGSSVGRLTRRLLLGDTIRDTGCSLRVMRREVALALPLEYRGMHRFIPLTARSLGFSVVELPVSHQPRRAGRTKYGLADRAIPGLIDCLAVRWLAQRRRATAWEPITTRRESAEPAREVTPLPSALAGT